MIRNKKTCYKYFFPQVNYNGRDWVNFEADKMADAGGKRNYGGRKGMESRVHFKKSNCNS